MKRTLWQLGRQIKYRNDIRNLKRSLKSFINPFKFTLRNGLPPNQIKYQFSRNFHAFNSQKPQFHQLGRSIYTSNAVRPSYGTFSTRTPQLGLGKARTFASGRGTSEIIQNVNIFTRAVLNQLGESRLSEYNNSISFKKQNEIKKEYKNYFVVPEYKSILIAPISSSLSHLLTNIPNNKSNKENDDGVTLFDGEFLQDLLRLKVSSNVHKKRLKILCLACKPIADTLEITTSNTNALILKASFEGLTPSEVEDMIEERMLAFKDDFTHGLNTSHLLRGWYRVYQRNGDVYLHDVVSQSFYLPDPLHS